jgi:hypothetical protein
VRLVLDSSVVIAAVQPSEPGHPAARALVDRLRGGEPGVELFAPPELWLEVHVVEQRLARSRRGGGAPGAALAGLAIALVAPDGAAEIASFLEHLALRMRGRRPMANATDLVYLWAGWSVGAAVVTLDEGVRGHHGLVCDVTAPEHALRGPARR